MKNMLHKNIIITLATIAILPMAINNAYAEEIVITGNGSGSSNTVEVSNTQLNTVTQNNAAEVNNNISTNSNTGNNHANSNTTGDTLINTGNSTTNTSVTNNMNNSLADTSMCCTAVGGSTTIAGNGAGSHSVVSHSNFVSNTTIVNQYANINNNINGSAVTGGNKANNNSGRVTINSGNIKVNENLKTNVNNAYVKLAAGGTSIFNSKIVGNGANSLNTILLNESSNNTVVVNNAADIFNNSVWNLITGDNTADNNNGDVSINTGNIVHSTNIENNANNSEVIIDCGCTPTPPPPPSSPCTQDCNPSNGGNGGNGGNGNGSSGGNGSSNNPSSNPGNELLPSTGGTPWMLLLILGNIIMMFMGMLLRLRSGNSPSIA